MTSIDINSFVKILTNGLKFYLKNEKVKILESDFHSNKTYEIGVDECARGPMFGRLYTAAVILPKDNSFKHELMKDSKKIKSRKIMKETSDYIKENAISWHIHYVEPSEIDEINIRQAVLKSMRTSHV